MHVAHEGRPQGTQRGNGHGAVLHVLGRGRGKPCVEGKEVLETMGFFTDILCGI